MKPASSVREIPCSACGVATDVYGKLRITAVDPDVNGEISEAKSTFFWRLCPKDYSKTIQGIVKAIDEV